ncbi:phosphatase PAP2 family protein [Phytohabitans kaempferiae]|uniref:Phosphatase PAP2 family protein n=1 Tax=Phytohabitans kaempferiae TaxID=1620943 RepID=A0ABV6M235_9ACTN
MVRRGWLQAATYFAGFVLLTGALAAGALLDVDVAVRDWVDAHRPHPLWLLAKGLYFLGSANLLAPILLAAAAPLALRDRTPRPVLLVLVTAAASYAVVVPLKVLTDRSAPHAPWPGAVDLFAHDAGWSYPSGHVVNTLIWYPVLVVLVERWLRRPLSGRVRRALLVPPVVIVFVAVTYLGYHWITDCVAGVLLGLALRQALLEVRIDAADRGRPADTRAR